MSTTSRPGSGSSFNQRIEQKTRDQAEIFEQVFQETLTRLETPVTDSIGRLTGELNTSLSDMEKALNQHTENVDTSLQASEALLEARLVRMERRNRGLLWRWLAPFLLGVVLTGAIPVAGMIWFSPQVWSLLQLEVLNRAGLEIAPGSGGSRWIRFPAGTTTWTLSEGIQATLDQEMYMRIPGS